MLNIRLLALLSKRVCAPAESTSRSTPLRARAPRSLAGRTHVSRREFGIKPLAMSKGALSSLELSLRNWVNGTMLLSQRSRWSYRCAE